MRAEALLEDLRESRTDLAQLVEKVRDDGRSVVVVSSSAVSAWSARSPDSWAKVREWLDRHGVTVRVV